MNTATLLFVIFLDVVAETFITFNLGQGIKLIRILSLS